MNHEIAFEMSGSSVRYGAGVTREVGMDLADLGLRHALVITDPLLRQLRPVQIVLESLESNKIAHTLFDRVRVEPSEESFLDAIAFANRTEFQAIVAVGGGSTIDTAKAVNLYTTYPPEDFLDYVNPPIGKGLPVPGPLKPLIAIPTTAGTGSETTGVAIFDLSRMHAKTGIASRRLKPTLGLLDPENTRTMPAQVAAATGLDVLSHAIESYTAMPYLERGLPDRPLVRPAYQGSNPISDVWSLQALRMVSRFLVRAVEDPSDDEAREDGAGFRIRGNWIWKLRGASTAWNVLSGLWNGEELFCSRLSCRSRYGAAWNICSAECAIGVSVHRQHQSPTTS
jgi:hydroxyacid-oxoacid transhydrogenase